MTIATVIVDDHPAMRAGVTAVLEATDDIAVVGSAAGEAELWPILDRADPDAVLLDFHLRGDDGIVLCHRIKRAKRGLAVVLYSEFADRTLIAPAMLAQADALLSKRAPAPVLCQALRDVSGRSTPIPTLRPDHREQLGAMLEPPEVTLAALLLSRRPVGDIAEAMQLTVDEVTERTEALLRRIVAERSRLES